MFAGKATAYLRMKLVVDAPWAFTIKLLTNLLFPYRGKLECLQLPFTYTLA
jgi:hypothetical protein